VLLRCRMQNNERTSRRLASVYDLEALEQLHQRCERAGHEGPARVLQRAISLRVAEEYRAAVDAAKDMTS
jgi:hypothetical protein